MDDTLTCPICGLRMRTINLDGKYLNATQKTADYTQRICNKGMNHTLSLFADKSNNQVDFISFSLNPKYSRSIEIDFLNQKCRISCMKNGEAEYIEIPKMIIPDFPHLTKLKERIGLYVVFS